MQLKIIVIGGSNIDICAESFEQLVEFDFNPGTIQTSYGGVARNIADNLSRLNFDVEFITAFGGDEWGKNLLKNCKERGINIENSLILKDLRSSTYISILDKNKEMKIAVSDMKILEYLDKNCFSKLIDHINEKNFCVLDINLPEESLEFLLNNIKIPVFLDCVSTKKAMKIKNLLKNIFVLKPNRIEAEKLSGIEIKNDEDLEKCANYFLEKGVKNIYISLGKDGIYYSNGRCKGKVPSLDVKVLNVNGAVDAFMAGVVYGHSLDKNIDEVCKLGIAAASIAVMSNKTISDDMSLEKIKDMLKYGVQIK